MNALSRLGRIPRQEGQAMVEFIIIFWFAFSLLMLVIQIVLAFNAHSMVKLAAFNAARAAIVARADEPEAPVTLERMQERARLAAFLTILPVIPGFHAQTLTFGNIGSLVTQLGNQLGGINSIGGVTALLKGHGKGVLAVLVEYFSADATTLNPIFDVRFVNPTAADPLDSNAKIDDWADQVEFDDPARAADNRIKVVVEWYYPLVIPLADQILYAMRNPGMYALALVQQGELAAAFRQMAGIDQRPVWEVGWGLRNPGAFGPWNLTGFRIPIRGSYVMRMQWDRKPK